jgi:hypothetical protein
MTIKQNTPRGRGYGGFCFLGKSYSSVDFR